jgi:hypothetical protein
MNRPGISIVSGLPRSGTSMMMQMIAAGGVEPLIDGVRAPDPDNPKGYYEFERVKQIKSDKSWLEDAKGRVVKMVHLLLLDLPAIEGLDYSIIFMRRDLDEVLASQAAMLKRLGRPAAPLPPAQLKSIYLKQIEQVYAHVSSRADMRLLEVQYKDVVEDPVKTASMLAQFLGGSMNTQAMSSAVDPTLYRNKA